MRKLVSSRPNNIYKPRPDLIECIKISVSINQVQNYKKNILEIIQMMRLLKLICIENNINDKVVKVKNKGMQESKGLNRELKLDKQNN